MPDDERVDASQPLGSPTSVATQVLWRDVTGDQLEELLHGLLDAMGASSLTWRAGSNTGGTATDGGRDLEATFDRPSPDGDLDRQTWWVECKGRADTLERSAVQQAVLDGSARQDVDVLVIATNSRFSNPTRDWVAERERTVKRPAVKLWDRDNLDRLVRRYPTVAARVLPDVLSDEDRLRLLITRFEELGEEPTSRDLEYFWERRNWLKEQNSQLLVEAIAVFLYAEGISLPRLRSWWTLLGKEDLLDGIVAATINVPNLLYGEPRARPLEEVRVLASAARILMFCLLNLPEGKGSALAFDPWSFVVGGEEIRQDSKKLQDWQQGVLLPVLAFLQGDLIDACSTDCSRVTADNPHEEDSLTASSFWSMVSKGSEASRQGTILIEACADPCTVGLDVSHGCPLIVSNDLTAEQILKGIERVLKFRETKPTGAAQKLITDDLSNGTMTMLRHYGLEWSTVRIADKGEEREK